MTKEYLFGLHEKLHISLSFHSLSKFKLVGLFFSDPIYILHVVSPVGVLSKLDSSGSNWYQYKNTERREATGNLQWEGKVLISSFHLVRDQTPACRYYFMAVVRLWDWTIKIIFGKLPETFSTQQHSYSTLCYAETENSKEFKKARAGGGGERRRENREYIGSGEVSSSSICIVTERFVAFSWHEKFKLCQFSLTFLDLKGREGFSPQFCCSLSAQCWSEDTFNKTKI